MTAILPISATTIVGVALVENYNSVWRYYLARLVKTSFITNKKNARLGVNMLVYKKISCMMAMVSIYKLLLAIINLICFYNFQSC